MKIFKAFLIIVFFAIYPATESIAQNEKIYIISDSLNDLSYKELAIRFNKNRKDFKKAKIYAKTYLYKGKRDNAKNRIAQGYHFMSFLNDNNRLELIYLDSAIHVTNKMKNSDYPSMSYVMKGDFFFKKRDFKKALDNYVFASEYATKSNIDELKYRIEFNIGLLKTRLGYFNESISIFNHCKDYYLKVNDVENYLLSLFALSDANVRLKKFKEATLINKKGFICSLNNGNNRMLNYFILEEGVNQYWQHNYKSSVDSIVKIMPFIKSINDMPNLAMGNYYLGLNYYETGNIEKAIIYFKNVDDIFKKLNDLHPDTRKGYELLINYYKKKNNIKNQLYYIEQLMKLDSILNINYKYLSHNIDSKYDTPRLISEKEKVIVKLTKESFFSTLKIIGLFIIVVILLAFVLYSYKKQKKYQSNFVKLLHTLELENKNNKEEKLLGMEEFVSKNTSNLDILEHIVKDLENKIRNFERDLGFLSRDCNLSKVSSDFETNTNYLSKIINAKKGVSFSVYINELRIDYAIKELQKNRKFRSYTIKAIAETVGFNTAETFSKAFFAKSGIHPSYFIKELKNKEI